MARTSASTAARSTLLHNVQLSHPWLRVSGVVLAGAGVFILDINNPSATHQLWLPLVLAVAAYLMTQSLMAVAFASFALASAHTSFNDLSWIPARGYPAIALLSLGVCLIIGTQRFRRRIAETHDARWAARNAATKSCDE